MEVGKVEFSDPNFKPNAEPNLIEMAKNTVLYELAQAQHIEQYNNLVSQVHKLLSKMDELFNAKHKEIEEEKIKVWDEMHDWAIDSKYSGKQEGLELGVALIGEAFKEVFENNTV